MARNPKKIPRLLREFTEAHRRINGVLLENPPVPVRDIHDCISLLERSEYVDVSEKDLIARFLLATDQKNLWVIDWGTVVSCNPMFDIAKTYYLLRWGQSPEKKPLRVRLVEGLVCRYLSGAYLSARGRKNDK